jgi:hypothetical protein
MTLGICRPGSQALNSQRQESTPASIWQALAGIPITDELLEWPADLFALTNVILERSEAFRFTLSPPCGLEWPPPRFPSWSDTVEEAGRSRFYKPAGIFAVSSDVRQEDLPSPHALCRRIVTIHRYA